MVELIENGLKVQVKKDCLIVTRVLTDKYDPDEFLGRLQNMKSQKKQMLDQRALQKEYVKVLETKEGEFYEQELMNLKKGTQQINAQLKVLNADIASCKEYERKAKELEQAKREAAKKERDAALAKEQQE